MRRKDVVSMIGVLLVAGMAAMSEKPASAQAGAAAPPQRVAVTTTQVKPDMVATWRDLIQKEAVPAFKKAGIPWRWVFTSGPLGGQAFTFTTVTPVANFAQYDQPPAIQRTLGPDGAAIAMMLEIVAGSIRRVARRMTSSGASAKRFP